MAFYENTIVAKQDLAEKELKIIKEKYNEIINKSRSLKGVLEPFSSNANLQMLKRSGFKDIFTVFKYHCFEGWLAIK